VVSSDTEVSAKAFRRCFTAEYKLDILKPADTCTALGSLGALLRREGLYSSNINTWRRQRDRGVLSGLTPKRRGRKELGRDPLIAENDKLRKENDRLTKCLKRAETIIDVQKKYQRYWRFISRRPPRKEGPTNGSRNHSFNRYWDQTCLRITGYSPLGVLSHVGSANDPLRHPGHLQPLCRRLDDCYGGIRDTGRKAYQRNLCKAEYRKRSAHGSCGPGFFDAIQAGGIAPVRP